jgi:hypothetical protein
MLPTTKHDVIGPVIGVSGITGIYPRAAGAPPADQASHKNSGRGERLPRWDRAGDGGEGHRSRHRAFKVDQSSL